ncbi:unnamed protein product (macronuclear) [Paramecium tetraurelia]|uniref:Chromosome undetermined scaffold_71, whole genome shotgun sequence n=1 Tax=Paramecium tetraurelia TaxID=5888 RepID=Q3SD62_PARTE|nr:uncharacterized protein GSPATT00021943001 [Paramecium tetraurelia]CAI44503.1 rab_C32 [Paramecium tetraurelia]CAK88775.1 unnamed protein product [Paramecium tetraurelia]|eukprot:XP_001456172.1 hypothetical protein (macronuclear) [Paramecium tetraurelia strain d4-2]
MTEPKAQYDELYKIILVGDSSVGKTSFLIRLTKNVIKKQSQPTIGVEYAAQSILLADVDKIVKSVIWDTAGAEKYKAITTAHYRKSEGALLFYDLCDKTSFDNVLSWRQEIIQHTDDKIMIMLIGNKLDLLQDNPQNRCVSVEEVEQICQQHNMLYNETSAKEGTNVKECFEQLIRKIYEFKQQNVEEEFPSQRIEIEDEKSEKKTQEQPQPNVLTVPTKQNRNPSDNCCGST